MNLERLDDRLVALGRMVEPVPLATVEGWIAALDPRSAYVAPHPLGPLARFLARLHPHRSN